MSSTEHESAPHLPESEVTEPEGAGPNSPDSNRPDSEIIGASDTMPPIPDEIREAGRLAPDHWLGMVDPTWSGEGSPPDWAMVGRWRSGLDGEIEEWQDNEDYRPSPRALGWPEPADEVDAAVQLAATGYGPGEDVVTALASHEVAVFTKPEGGPLPALTPDGTAVVPTFTSPVYLHTAGRLAFELVKVPDLLDQLPEGHLLYLNPSGPVSMTVELDALRDAINSTESAESAEPSRSAGRPVSTVSLDVPGAGGASTTSAESDSPEQGEQTGETRGAEG